MAPSDHHMRQEQNRARSEVPESLSWVLSGWMLYVWTPTRSRLSQRTRLSWNSIPVRLRDCSGRLVQLDAMLACEFAGVLDHRSPVRQIHEPLGRKHQALDMLPEDQLVEQMR